MKRYGIGILVALGFIATLTHGQVITPTNRNGQMVAYAGPAAGGTGIDHRYLTPTSVHDEFSVSNPGPPFSTASASIDAVLTPTSLTLAGVGSAHRDVPIGSVSSYAAFTDSWQFTLSAPACFTFTVHTNVSSTDGGVQGQGYSLGGPLTVDPGIPIEWLAQAVTTPGSITRVVTGQARAGSYVMSINGRAERTNSAAFPWSGSYSHSISVVFGPAALVGQPGSAVACTAGSASFSVTPAAGGAVSFQWQRRSTALPAWTNITAGENIGPGLRPYFDAVAPTAATLTLAPPASRGSYIASDFDGFEVRCVVTSGCGSVTSDAAGLTICIADMDDGSGSGACDGGVTIDDLLYMLLAFEQGDLRADVDDGSFTGTPDGGVTIDDLLYYLVRFESGC